MAKKRDSFNRRTKLANGADKKSTNPRLDKNQRKKKSLFWRLFPKKSDPEEDETNVSSEESGDNSQTPESNQHSGGTNQDSTSSSQPSPSSSSFNSGGMEGIIGEVRMFAATWAPRGWALCDGQLLSIAQHTALFSIIGTIYGGDGRTTFALPDLRGRVPVHPGHGPGLSEYRSGDKGGSEQTTLTSSQMPNHGHNHDLKKTSNPEEFGSDMALNEVKTNQSEDINLANTGGGQAIDLRQPYLGISFIICLQGIYPSRS